MQALLGKTLEELTEVALSLGFPKFTAKQMADWLYQKQVNSIEEMTNLSKKSREILSQQYEVGAHAACDSQESIDGTKKYVFKIGEGHYIETAMIPEKERKTVCISCQLGCKMDCLFCMTGKQGFQGNLSAGDIINQLRSIPEAEEITNIVFMGMGEPLDNWGEVQKALEILCAPWGYAMSPRRITLSTIGLKKNLEYFLKESECHLAVSLHSPFSEQRLQLMPAQQGSPVEDIIEMIRKHDFGRQRRISFEYIMFEGINDRPEDIKGLTKLLQGLRCRVNLIRFHAIPGVPLRSPEESHIAAFKDRLNAKGILTTVRVSRGEDILAACGLLSGKHINQERGRNE